MAVDMADLRMKVENEIKSCLGMGGTRVLDLNTMNCYHMGFCDRDGNPCPAQRESICVPFSASPRLPIRRRPEQAIPAAGLTIPA